VQPTAQHVSTLPDCGLAIDFHVSPPQDGIPALYRGHDAFFFTSRYEAWGMPVMEAMASGLAVVATNCLGVASFARHSVNALLADPQVGGQIERGSCTTRTGARGRGATWRPGGARGNAKA
jgi:glycosyltransferase involved in cell wall biosynthesis